MPPLIYEGLGSHLEALGVSGLLVLDETLARHLRAGLGREVKSVYPYLAERSGKQLAGPYAVFEAFRAAWQEVSKALGLKKALSFFELWDFAQRFARDLGEILLARRSPDSPKAVYAYLMEELRYVQADKLIQETFSIREGRELPWLDFLPLPRRYQAQELAQLFQNLSEVGRFFLDNLAQRGRALGEYLLATASNMGSGACLWNVLSPEPLWDYWRQVMGPRNVGWDVSCLAALFGEAIWPERSHPAIGFPLYSEVSVEITQHLTALDLLMTAAKAIGAQAKTHLVAVWLGEPRYLELLRYLLRQEGVDLSAFPTSALETPTGLHLAQSLQRGQVPDPQGLRAYEGSLVWRLYFDFYQERMQSRVLTQKGPSLEALERFIRFLRKLPAPLEESTQDLPILIGSLSELVGGAYEVLFVLFPPREPLGPWLRPSFLPLGLRLRYTTPKQHQQMAWRLTSLLFASASKVYLHRLAGEAAISPMEEFLDLVPERARLWRLVSVKSASLPVASLTLPSFPDLVPKASLGQLRFSPTDLATFLQCPRRYYWKRVVELPEGLKGASAYRGEALHRALHLGLSGPIAPWRLESISVKRSLRSLKWRWRPSHLRLLYRRAYARLVKRQPLLSLTKDPEARLNWYFLALAGSVYFGHLVESLGGPPLSKRYCFFPEVWLSPQIAPAYLSSVSGRLDLLVQDEAGTPRLVMDFKTSRIEKKVFEHFFETFEGYLAWLRGHSPAPPNLDKSKGFAQALQAYAYVAHFSGAPLKLVVAHAIAPKDFFIQEPLEPTFERARFVALWEAAVELLRSWLSSAPKESLRDRFIMTPDEEHCKYCPYNLLCHRL